MCAQKKIFTVPRLFYWMMMPVLFKPDVFKCYAHLCTIQHSLACGRLEIACPLKKSSLLKSALQFAWSVFGVVNQWLIIVCCAPGNKILSYCQVSSTVILIPAFNCNFAPMVREYSVIFFHNIKNRSFFSKTESWKKLMLLILVTVRTKLTFVRS
jgi:hypothetical protein